MADDKGLNLNNLDRYTKLSPRFVLEEYSHCEVPAGCGGIVLRWRNPEVGIPIEFWHYTPGKHLAFPKNRNRSYSVSETSFRRNNPR